VAEGKLLGLLVPQTDPVVFVGNVREVRHLQPRLTLDTSADDLTGGLQPSRRLRLRLTPQALIA
jgi:hypothetical protein